MSFFSVPPTTTTTTTKDQMYTRPTLYHRCYINTLFKLWDEFLFFFCTECASLSELCNLKCQIVSSFTVVCQMLYRHPIIFRFATICLLYWTSSSHREKKIPGWKKVAFWKKQGHSKKKSRFGHKKNGPAFFFMGNCNTIRVNKKSI